MQNHGVWLHRAATCRAVAAWSLLIAALSSVPNFAPPASPPEFNADKLAHFALYFALGALAYAAARRTRPGAPVLLAVRQCSSPSLHSA